MHVIRSLILAGMEYGVIKLLNRLDTGLFEPSICCLMDAKDDARSALRDHIPVFELREEPNGIHPRLIYRLSKRFRDSGIDIVHSHNWGTFLYADVAARLANVPVMIHGEHGRDTREHEEGWKRSVIWNALKGNVHKFVAVSENIAEDLVSLMRVPPEKIVVIPNGVDTEIFRPDRDGGVARKNMGIGGDRKIIGTVGWFREVKDHETLIRAFSRVKARAPEAFLLIIGESTDPERTRTLRKLASDLGVADFILFLGGRADVPELLAAIDVYVNSSIYEGMSNTILEAMAAGKPVVATRVGGTPKIVEDGTTGILVPPKDEIALSEEILTLFRDRETAMRMGESGRKRIERLHSMEYMVLANQDVYLKSLRGKINSRGEGPEV
jgi:sugar transferase (PEP-CTERM/EpsH1 system associated)